jgi:hypothetical protein
MAIDRPVSTKGGSLFVPIFAAQKFSYNDQQKEYSSESDADDLHLVDPRPASQTR